MTDEERRELDILVAEFGPYDYAMDARENHAELGGLLLICAGFCIGAVSKDRSLTSFFVGGLVIIPCLYFSWLSFREARYAERAYYRIQELRQGEYTN